MSTQTDQPELPVVVLPPRIERRMAEIARRVYLPQIQVLLYEEHLTDDEAKSLFEFLPSDAASLRLACEKQGKEYRERSQGDLFVGNGFQNVIRLAGLRDMMPEKLILDIAYEFGLLHGEPEYRRLTKHFCGEDRHSPTLFICFADGELRVDGQVIRKIKRFRDKPSKLEYILKSFEEGDWKRKEIDFKGTYHSKQVGDAVTALNKGQTKLKFSVESCTAISWRPNASA